MSANSELWIPPQSPKAQKKIDSRKRYQIFLKWTGLSDKTLLDLLGIFLIPIVITAATLWFSWQQSEASSQASEKQYQTTLQIAKDQQQENALQVYLDHMSDLLLNNKLHESQPGDEVRNVARSRTLTILPQLDGNRKGELVRFLYESGLIDVKNTIIDLNGANLSRANLLSANLLSANFQGTNLIRADLTAANLQGANLSDSWLYDTDFIGATGTTPEQLEQSTHLIGATMPDGSIHP